MRRRTLLRNSLATGGGIAALALVGCGDDDDDDDVQEPTSTGDSTATTTAPEETPTAGVTTPTGTLRVAHASLGQDSFNAHFDRATANTVTYYPVYSTLTNYDVDRNDVGEVAESWETPDELTWIWHLKPGIIDHAGHPMDAETVGWNIDHFATIAETSLTGRFYESYEVMDDVTLKITTNAPFVAGAQHAAGFGEARLYSMRAFEEMGEDAFYQAPVGTGPFRFDSRSIGEFIKFKAFPDYFDGPPGVETLEYYIVPEQATRIAQLQTGQADIISGIAGTVVDQLEGNDDIELMRIEDSSWMVLSPFDRLDPDSELHDPRVMAALNYAVDKEGIVEGIYRGRGKPAPYGFFSPVTKGYHDDHEKWEYDPERAKVLLAEAGYPDGFEMGDMWVTDLSQFPLAPAVIEAINNNLRDVGVQSGLRNIEYGAYIEEVRNGNGRGLIYLASANLPDVSLGLPVWVASTSAFAPFPDGPLDAQVAAQATEFDPEARLAVLTEIFDTLNKTPMMVFTVSPDTYLARGSHVSDWPQPRATAYIQAVQHITVSS